MTEERGKERGRGRGRERGVERGDIKTGTSEVQRQTGREKRKKVFLTATKCQT